MTTELRLQNQSQQLWTRAISGAWRNRPFINDPSLWLLRDPDAEEKMLRDADIAHAIGFRRHLIAGKEWACVAKDATSPRAELGIDVATRLLDNVCHFTDARLNLARAFFSGSRFARIHGTTKRMALGDGIDRVWWIPTKLEDMDKRMYRRVSAWDPVAEKLEAHWERWHIGPDKFIAETEADAVQTVRHVYQDDQATLGHGRALREALGWWWYAKEHVFQESLQAIERFAQGIIHARVDGLRHGDTGVPNNQLVSDWVDLLEDLRGRHVLVSDKADEIDIISGNAEGWQMMHTIREELRSTIFTLVLGANLTTAANEGGSYALAEIQENSTEALIQYDRQTLEETLTKDLLGCIWFKNWPNMVELGLADDMPRFAITQEKKQDPKERAEVAAILNGMGVDLAADELYEQTGFTKPEPGEDIIEGSSAPADPFGAFGGGNPFGQPTNGQPPQPAQPAETTVDNGGDPPGSFLEGTNLPGKWADRMGQMEKALL